MNSFLKSPLCRMNLHRVSLNQKHIVSRLLRVFSRFTLLWTFTWHYLSTSMTEGTTLGCSIITTLIAFCWVPNGLIYLRIHFRLFHSKTYTHSVSWEVRSRLILHHSQIRFLHTLDRRLHPLHLLLGYLVISGLERSLRFLRRNWCTVWSTCAVRSPDLSRLGWDYWTRFSNRMSILLVVNGTNLWSFIIYPFISFRVAFFDSKWWSAWYHLTL